MLSYQVGEIDESGFVCIGIEERKRESRDLNRTLVEKGGTYSDVGSDYSSSEEYSSGFSENR